MRILIHDYPGYAFPAQLARALAARGHWVRHVHLSATIGPKGTLRALEGDPATLSFQALELSGGYQKYNLVRRFFQERDYARKLVRVVHDFGPDVVLSNAQPHVQELLLEACRYRAVPLVHWLQDIYGTAIGSILGRRFRSVGALAGGCFGYWEKRVVHGCARVVCISDAFSDEMRRWGISGEKIARIDNWSPLPAIPVLRQENAWTERHGLAGLDVVLYAGTLGWKHNPALLEKLAIALRDRPQARLVVASEGLGASWLAERKAAGGLDNLVLLPFQPEEDFAAMLASAKVLLAILETDASAYSAPSKILSYLCAARPIVASFPPENHSARLLSSAQAGIVCPPGDDAGFVDAACRLLALPEEAVNLAINGRGYAERHFRIDDIADAFERVLHHA